MTAARNARAGLPFVYQDRPDRVGRDRLEILTTLIAGPSFDPIFRPDVIDIPPQHPIYRWECVVDRCERSRSGGTDLCSEHLQNFARERERGVGKAAFVSAATGLMRHVRAEEMACRVCPQRPVAHTELRLCQRHLGRWWQHEKTNCASADLAGWLGEQVPLAGYGSCRGAVCTNLADSPLGLCPWHSIRYRRDSRPGGARLPSSWWHRYEQFGRPVPIDYADEAAFGRWCATAAAPWWPGQINLRGLRPLVRAEIKWGLFMHTQRVRPTRWDLGWLRSLVTTCRDQDVDTLIGFPLGAGGSASFTGAIVKEILHELRLVYFTPAETKEAGFIETDHFGVRFDQRASHVDLTGIPQRWLRDLVWEYLAAMLQSPRCPRSGGVVDGIRRAAIELGTFLQIDVPNGDDPAVLDGEHMRRFVADQRRRERDGMASLAITQPGGKPSIVTTVTRSIVCNALHKMLRDALDTGAADRIGLAREFIVTVPTAGATTGRTPRRPFPDELARALAEDNNLRRLAEVYDPQDRGLRDIWEITVTTGRRIGEVLQVRWDCLGGYGGLPMFWHDQTKVGNYDVAIRIPERLHDVIAERQRTTLERFIAQHGRRPADTERAGLALFPTTHRNHDGTVALSYQWFHHRFREWIAELDLGHCVPHQARHTLATNLLRAGASLTHIRRYLGQVSDRMAEHYVHLSNSDLEDVLQQVWVAGPGATHPGELLTGDTASPMTREQAQVLAIDLSRRSTPAEGGFCTFQPVVDGGACPWNLDCHNCDKFVLSGADLLYWRRKREQWRQLAEGAPDDATADYLHRYFEPTARAIDGLEAALAGIGLLDQALAMDLRKPQDYFHRVWATAFRATDLADTTNTAVDESSDTTGDEQEECA